MKKIITVIISILLLAGCSKQAADLQNDPSVSQMVPEEFIMQGELKEINENRLLIDLENQGLTWVSIQDDSDLNIAIHSIVKVQIIGGIMESFPGQASGRTVVVVTPFIENSIHSYDEMVTMLNDEDLYPVVVWNGPKDMVAYANRSEGTNNYVVFVASLYEEDPWMVAQVYKEVPDLNWFYDRVEIQTSGGAMEFGPDFDQVDPYVFGETEDSDQGNQPVEEPLYSLIPQTYEDKENNVVIQYVLVEAMKGELVQDYANQSLKRIVDIFGQGYDHVTIDYRILQQDDFLTVLYTGRNDSMGYGITKVISMHMPTATELTIDNTVTDKVAFEGLFKEKSGYDLAMLEGVEIYIAEGELIATFVPTDDSAKRQYVHFNLLENRDLFHLEYEMPAS